MCDDSRTDRSTVGPVPAHLALDTPYRGRTILDRPEIDALLADADRRS